MYLKDLNNFSVTTSTNATTATKANTLATARTINGTSFNGGANITTANWGTARTLTIGSTGKSVNGSGNVAWSLSEIGAAPASHTHSYLPLNGGTLTGDITFNKNNYSGKIFDIFGSSYGHAVNFGGGAMTIVSAGESGANIIAEQGLESEPGTERLILASDAEIRFTTNCNTIENSKSAILDPNLYLYPNNNNDGFIGTSSHKWKGMYATTFYGALSGNASTATKLATARTINGVSFDGSANITVADSTKLPLSGGTVTGNLNVGGVLASTGVATKNCGTTANPWLSVIAKNLHLYGTDGQTYGSMRAYTEGTTSTVGENRTYLGNGIASGTAGNAKGSIVMYGSNTGYTWLQPNNNSTSNITVYLPSAGGHLPVWSKGDTSYWGMHNPDGSTSWVRTTSSGLIPYDQNKTSSIGTSSWKFNSMYADTFYGNLSGNATTATTLQTARTINGTSFNGSANITTANWGTARTITLGGTGKSVNGSGNVSWSLAEIMKGQGNNASTAAGTLYFVNGAKDHVGRVSCYQTSSGEDYTQLAILTNDGTNKNYMNIYTNKINVNSGMNFGDECQINKASGNTYFITRRTDTGTEVQFGVGEGGTNHGVYSTTQSRWIIWGDKTNVYIPGFHAQGNIQFNNNGNVRSKTASAVVKTDGTNLAAGTSIDILNYNSSHNLHLGGGINTNAINVGSTYVTGAVNTLIRTNNADGYIAIQPGNSTKVQFFSGYTNVANELRCSSNIRVNGKRLSITTGAPASPATGDIWIDI